CSTSFHAGGTKSSQPCSSERYFGLSSVRGGFFSSARATDAATSSAPRPAATRWSMVIRRGARRRAFATSPRSRNLQPLLVGDQPLLSTTATGQGVRELLPAYTHPADPVRGVAHHHRESRNVSHHDRTRTDERVC